MAALTYMQRRRSGIYEFRRRLPTQLAGKPASRQLQAAFPDLINLRTGRFKHEIVRSLGTKDLPEAKLRDHQQAIRVTALFAEACRGVTQSEPSVFSEADIGDIADAIAAEFLASDEAEREQGDDRRRLQTDEDRQRWLDLVPLQFSDKEALGMERDHFVAYGDYLDELDAEYGEALARHDVSIVDAEVNAALRKRNFTLHPSSPMRRRLALAALKSIKEAVSTARARQRGEVVSVEPILGEQRGPKLTEAMNSWKRDAGASGMKQPTARTIMEAGYAVRQFVELHGDCRIGDIGRDKARAYRDALVKVPKQLSAKLKALPLPRLLERNLSDYPPRSAATVNKHLNLLSAIISYSEAEGLLDGLSSFANPFGKTLKLKLDAGRGSARGGFGAEQLRSIFRSEVYSGNVRPRGGGGEAAFWFPLIGLLSGMRLDEIAGLRVCDLRLDENSGHWFFYVNQDGGRRLKTASSSRRVPVHPELIRAGLLAYRETVASTDTNGALWPDLTTTPSRPRSAAWSQWFGRYLRDKAGVTDRRMVFHSFRHTFKRMCRDAGLSEELHDALTGHTSAGGVGRQYGGGFSTPPLAAALDRVVSPVDLSEIVWTKHQGR